jgi:hypothetical protein
MHQTNSFNDRDSTAQVSAKLFNRRPELSGLWVRLSVQTNFLRPVLGSAQFYFMEKS